VGAKSKQLPRRVPSWNGRQREGIRLAFRERDQQQVVAAAKEVQAQQAAIAENQKKIDEKLAAIAEALRQAKIYSARGR